MAKQLGRALLLKRGATATAGPYSTLAGVRSRTLNLSTNAVDTTTSDPDDPDAVPQRTVIAGIQDQAFDASGLFDNTTAKKAMADDARLGRAWQYQVTIPGYGTIEGQRIVTGFSFTGDTEDAMGFTCNVVPYGAQTFTAEV